MGSLLGGGECPVERGRGSLPSLSLSPALPRKRVGDTCTCCVTSWALDPPL
jgi:hypothetical protein